MASELRIDRGTLRPPKRRADGTLLVEGVLTRSGVFIYRDAQGNERREYRPPDEVFKADSMESFHLVPLTDDHPAELVTSRNAKALSVGAVGLPRRDGSQMVAPLAVFDADTIAKVESGKQELSNGYHAEIVDESGTSPEGERYDAIQRNIRGNHVAIVDIARAGREARMRLDGGAAAMIETPAREMRADSQERNMKIRIDGVEYDVSEQVAQAIAKQDAAHAESVKAEKARADAAVAATATATATATAERDSARVELAAEKARADAAIAGRDKAVEERVSLERQAATVLGEVDAKATDKAIKLAVVKKVDGEDLPADAHEAYVQGRFDSAVKRAGAADASLAAARGAVLPLTAQRADDDLPDEDEAQRKSLERLDAQWKNPAANAAKSEAK